MKIKKKESNDKNQAQKFVDKAKELKVDESPKAFEQIFDQVISAPKFAIRKKVKKRKQDK